MICYWLALSYNTTTQLHPQKYLVPIPMPSLVGGSPGMRLGSKHIRVPETRFYILYRAGAPDEATPARTHTLPGAQLRIVQDDGSK